MCKMNKFLKSCLDLKYVSNKNGGHEKNVEKLLKEYDFKYEAQPNGSQAYPDFYVWFKGVRHEIECKSSKQTFPTFNGGLPHSEGIYVFSSERYDETTLFRGCDVVGKTKRKEYDKVVSELNEVLDRHRETWKEDPRGFDFYIRNMYTQMGRGKKDYFKHPDRARCESDVINGSY